MITEIINYYFKNSVKVLNSKMEELQERIRELKDGTIEIMQFQQWTGNRLTKKDEQSLKDLENYNKQTNKKNISAIGVLEINEKKMGN